MKKNPRIGSSFDDFLEEEGMLDKINTIAIKRVIAWQIEQGMAKKNLSKTEMAQQMLSKQVVS